MSLFDKFKAAFGKSTQGEWGSSAALSSDSRHIRYISGDLPDGSYGMIAEVCHPVCQSQEEALGNAAFIRDAHNAAPGLIAAVDALQEFVSDCEAAHPECTAAALREEWPDMAATYQNARQALVDLGLLADKAKPKAPGRSA